MRIGLFKGKYLSSFQIILAGFLAVILAGMLLLMLPFASAGGQWTSPQTALFTAASAVCVTGLVVRDTATYWSYFGQAVILCLIQTGGLGIVSVTAFFMAVSGRKVSLLQRSMLQESIAAHQVGGLVKMTAFIFKVTFAVELLGAIAMMPAFCRAFGSKGIWMSVFHSVSAFCNAGIDIMGDKTGAFSSFTFFRADLGVVLPVCLLIVIGGIGFLTWEDIAVRRFRFKEYRMQSKVVLLSAAVLIVIPAVVFFWHDFAAYPLKERICLSFFQSVTPRTAGFNTADMNAMTSTGHALTVLLMLIGGSPGSTAGGMKTTTVAVLLANSAAVIRRRKSARLFGRRIEERTINYAAAALLLHLTLVLTGAFVISIAERLSFSVCLFEAASAIGTVGLTLGITPSLGLLSQAVLIILMVFGRVGGLTVLFAAVGSFDNAAQYPVEKINVG